MKFFEKIFSNKNRNLQNNKTTEKITIQQEIIDSSCPKGFVKTTRIEIDNNTIESIKKRYIAFDVETTGLDPKTDRIIELGAVLFENGKIIKKFESLVNPEMSIPIQATYVNNITNDMIESAPKEQEVYLKFVEFLEDALNNKTAICAHNAKFDLDFLSETLMRLGYNANIEYIDTLLYSRKLIKGLSNYKQNTVASYLSIINEQEHRAVSDAETCGKIFWNLLNLKDKELEKTRQYIEKIKPNDEELQVCAYIQNMIIKNNGDSEWLRFSKNSSNYINIHYLYTFLKFKISRKGKFIIVDRKFANKLDDPIIEPCTLNEGGTEYIRLYFYKIFELEKLKEYILNKYYETRKSALDYINYNNRHRKSAIDSISMMTLLSNEAVKDLLQREYRGNAQEQNTIDKINVIDRTDVKINPINNRVSLENIKNSNNWDKGFDSGYKYWIEGDSLRKDNKFNESIELFDKARYNGYLAPVLYESYAMSYHKLKDYDNEIDILEEGIKRLKKDGINTSRLEARINSAIQLVYKEQQKEIKKRQKEIEKKIREQEKVKKSDISKGSNKRPIIQLNDKMQIINRFDSIAEAVRQTGINYKSIRDAAKGVQRHAGGYIWRYEDEMNEK